MDTPTTTAATILLEKGKSNSEVATTLRIPIEEVAALRDTLTLPPIPQKKQSLKEAARQYILDMSAQEKMEFFKEIDPYKLWTMAEGAPETKIDVSQEPVRIDITHQLLKVYGNIDGTVPAEVLGVSESSQLPEGSSK